MTEKWQTIIASSLSWEEAHASIEAATAGLAEELRGRRPAQSPHSAWELVEHIRLVQTDLVRFMEDADYAAPKWPEDYWPTSPSPSDASEWDESLAGIRHDCERLQQVATRPGLDLTTRIPWGEGQTYLRTILVAVDHTAYHVGQLIAVRRLLGAWP